MKFEETEQKIVALQNILLKILD